MYKMSSLILPSVLSAVGALGLVTHEGFNYNARVDAFIKSPFVISLMGLIMTRTSLVTESPSRLKSFLGTRFARTLLLLVVSFIATGDFENTMFLSVLFLGVVQLIRTAEEREKHPYIL